MLVHLWRSPLFMFYVVCLRMCVYVCCRSESDGVSECVASRNSQVIRTGRRSVPQGDPRSPNGEWDRDTLHLSPTPLDG